jgi:hypothetical protein
MHRSLIVADVTPPEERAPSLGHSVPHVLLEQIKSGNGWPLPVTSLFRVENFTHCKPYLIASYLTPGMVLCITTPDGEVEVVVAGDQFLLRKPFGFFPVNTPVFFDSDGCCYASGPRPDYDGDQLTTSPIGALRFDPTLGTVRVWTGSAWVIASGPEAVKPAIDKKEDGEVDWNTLISPTDIQFAQQQYSKDTVSIPTPEPVLKPGDSPHGMFANYEAFKPFPDPGHSQRADKDISIFKDFLRKSGPTTPLTRRQQIEDLVARLERDTHAADAAPPEPAPLPSAPGYIGRAGRVIELD